MRLSPRTNLAAVVVVGLLLSPLTASAGPREATLLPEPYAPGAPQTSDGVPGEIAQPLPAFRSLPRITGEVTWPIAPGLTFRQWQQTDTRGPNRVSVVTADLSQKSLRMRYLGDGDVRGRSRVKKLVERNKAVVGVNGDFFDIGDLGAPWGVGVDRQNLLHGPVGLPNAAFFVGPDQVPAFGQVELTTKVTGKQTFPVSRLNSPGIPKGGIGVYTRGWGKLAGRRALVVDTAPLVREVWIRKGKVVKVGRTLTKGERFRGKVVVGQGRGAKKLAGLRKGDRLSVAVRAVGGHRMAITSNAMLLRDGRIRPRDDREMHPRTAVGHDRETNQLFLVVVDGRSTSSRGMTMVELAGLLQALGADDALNLDGGGSSTLVAPDARGVPGVRNVPSDGSQRRVPNAIGFDLR